MQEHAYPASNEPLIFSRIMVGILDDDVIEVQILYRLYHAGIPIKALDRDKVVQRAAARGSAPLRSARATRIARAASASRVARGHCWAGHVRPFRSGVHIKPGRDPRKRRLCVLLQHAIKLELFQAFDMDALEFHHFGFHRLRRVDPHLGADALLA
jgi:hypothetical protein